MLKVLGSSYKSQRGTQETMIIVEDMRLAILFMLLSLLCLGSWPVFFNILERHGWLPQHTYLDYAASNFIVGSLFALIFGQLGKETSTVPNFITQLHQENWPSVGLAMFGGFVLCLGNILMQYSLAFLGISLTEVISASLAVVGGKTINYFLDNGLNQAHILFVGVRCFLAAVILGSLCHASNIADIDAMLSVHKGKKSSNNEAEVDGSDDSLVAINLMHSRVHLLSGHHSCLEECCVLFFFWGVNFIIRFTLLADRSVSLRALVDSFIELRHPSAVCAIRCDRCGARFEAIIVGLSLVLPPFESQVVHCCAIVGDDMGKDHIVERISDRVQHEKLHNYIGIRKRYKAGSKQYFQLLEQCRAIKALPLVGTFWGVVLFGEYKNSFSEDIHPTGRHADNVCSCSCFSNSLVGEERGLIYVKLMCGPILCIGSCFVAILFIKVSAFL